MTATREESDKEISSPPPAKRAKMNHQKNDDDFMGVEYRKSLFFLKRDAKYIKERRIVLSELLKKHQIIRNQVKAV